MSAKRSHNDPAGASDAVALDALSEDFSANGAASKGGSGKSHGALSRIGQLVNFKILIALFVLFVLVVSDVFTNNVVSGFRGAVRCRTPTSYGVVVQGIFLVIFYVLALHLIEGGVI